VEKMIENKLIKKMNDEDNNSNNRKNKKKSIGNDLVIDYLELL
jgi:hypothetical protein